MDNSASPASQATFHTPDSHPPPPVQTPGTASSAAAAALPPTSGKKRPLDDASPANDEEPGLLGRIVSSITPWKKRGRRSLEGMSGSAIKGANRTPAGGGNSEGVEGSGKKLRQLNLEQKFESPAVNGGGGNVPVQQAATAGQQQQPQPAGGMEFPASKRVRLAGAGRAVTLGGATTFASPPAATAPEASTTTGTPGGPTLAGAARSTPRFHMGSTSKPAATFRLRDVRGRMATPGGKVLLAQRRAVAARTATPGVRGALTANVTAPAGATPGARGALAAGGMMHRTASLSSVATTRHSNVGAGRSAGATLSRASGYRRRPIRARSFKPMSRLLAGVYSAEDQSEEKGAAGKQHTMLTESIASQILEENRNKLGLADGNGNTELALFGGNAAKSGDAAMDQARTFGEEAANYRAVTKANNVPRVRMNRILGSGQTGGRFHAPAQQSTAVAVAPAPAPLFAAAPAAAAPMAAAPVAQAKKAVTFQSPAKPAADAEMDDADGAAAPKPFVPFASDPVLARPTTDPSLKLTPLKPTQEEISRELGEEIEGRTQMEAWQRKAEANFGFDDPNVCTPRKSSAKKTKAKGTPHPKKAAASIDTPALLRRADDVAAKAGGNAGAPFSFMPGGAAASGTTTATPLGFKFGKTNADAPKLAAEESPAPAPAKAAESSPAPATAASGWGDLFKSKPGEWKCGTCYTRNPKEKTVCMACETPKPGAEVGGAASAESTPASGATTNGAKAAAGSIGAGGFSFGGTPAASAPKPAPSPAAAGGWSDAFKPKEDEWKCAKCFAKNAKGSDECADCGASKEGAGDKKSGGAPTPAKAKQGDDDGNDVKASIGAGGFSFGGAATASSSPAPASVGGAGGIGAGGFSFAGAATKTPANTPAKAKRGRDNDAGNDDSSGTPAAPSVGFTFGTSASAPAPAPEAKASVGFSFGAPSASGDEKKEDPASTSTAGAGFSFSAQPALKKKGGGGGGGGASIPGFAFGAPPASGSKAPAPAEKKEESSEPSSKKQMTFSFSKGGTPSLPVPAGDAAAPAAPGTPGFSFGAASEKKDDAAAAPSGTPAFAFGSSAAAAPTPAAGGFAFGTATEKKDDAASASKPAFGGFGGGAGATPAEGAAKPAFAFGATPAAAAEKKVESATSSQPAFAFGSTPAAAPKPAEAGAAPAFSFGGASAPVPAASGSTFAFGAGGASSSTPAPAKPPAPGGAGFAFGAAATGGATPAPAAGGFGGSTPAPATGGFGGSTPAPAPAGGGFGGFGGATGPTPAAAAPATPGGAFSFGAGGSTATPAAPSAGGFGATPAPATGGFGGFGSAAAPPAAAPATPGFAFGGAPAPTNPTTGFAPAAATPAPAFGGGAGFGATTAAMGGATPAAGGGFSIGTGGAKKTPGTGRTAGRRIVKARRPPGSGR